ncbi:hypothetical protein N7474_007398 [Penicillium riverlandense]|uniref:uncharacterized protein n=1 Tax=Penicillium riverlandense TaxID=1903569 RepID=UPI00254696B3|nr:uncharacterized protein N7474_007398 [Penicillium riverlandense]KAJ5815621.1 hypothetical protein N7474_007398 [Penicillium riverlandense]
MKSMRSLTSILQAGTKSRTHFQLKPSQARAYTQAFNTRNLSADPDPTSERRALNPERYETCKSGTDDEVAQHKSPYDPSSTTPESEHRALEDEYKLEGDVSHDPLFVSPANRDFSLILDPMVGGAVHNAQSLGSVRGWTNKHRTVLRRTAPFEFRGYEKVVWNLRKKSAQR